jgi:PD-(D/E)XK nuclease superfamily
MGDPAEFWLDNSKVETFHLCPRKYAYRFEEHLVPIDRKRDSALMFGGAIHKSLESLYKGTGFEKVDCPLGPCNHCRGNQIPRMSALFLANYNDDPEDPREIRTVDRGLEMLAYYVTKWGRESFKVLAVEKSFDITLSTEHSVGFKYIGRIDLIVRDDRTLMTVDHKTTTRFGTVFVAGFKLSGQFTGYMRGASNLLGGEPIHTAMANALRITTKIEDGSFDRIYTYRSPEEFDTWENEVRHVASEIQRMRETGFWPKSAPFACGAYNRICEYYPLCIAAAQTRETLKRSAYEVVPWEPRKESE